jgi:hypothetical protein
MDGVRRQVSDDGVQVIGCGRRLGNAGDCSPL